MATTLDALHDDHGSVDVGALVLGHPEAAEAETLPTFVAGNPGARERCRLLRAAYCQRMVVVGDRPALANSLKLAVNDVVLVIQDRLGQVMPLARRATSTLL